MALQNKVFRSTSTQAALPRIEPEFVTQAMFAATGAAATYAIGTLVAWDVATGHWAVWDGDGSAQYARVDGVVWSEVVPSTAGEIMGSVMTKGAFHYDDILTINVTDGSYGTAAELRADLQIEAIKTRGLRVIGLKGTPE